MAAVDVGVGGEIRLVFHNIGKIQQAFFKHLILRVEQPFFTLRMVGGNGPVKGREKDKAGFLDFFRHR